MLAPLDDESAVSAAEDTRRALTPEMQAPGGADGEVVEVKIVVGGEGDVVGGRGGGSATGAIDGLVEHFARVAAEAGTDDDESS